MMAAFFLSFLAASAGIRSVMLSDSQINNAALLLDLTLKVGYASNDYIAAISEPSADTINGTIPKPWLSMNHSHIQGLK